MYGLGRHLSHLTQIPKITLVPTTHGCSTHYLCLDEMFAKNGGDQRRSSFINTLLWLVTA